MIASIMRVFTMESLKIIANLEVEVESESATINGDSKCGKKYRDIAENQTLYEDPEQPCNQNCHASKDCPCWKNSGKQENNNHNQIFNHAIGGNP